MMFVDMICLYVYYMYDTCVVVQKKYTTYYYLYITKQLYFATSL